MTGIFEISLATDETSATAAMMSLVSKNLLWHPEENAADTIHMVDGEYVSLFTAEEAVYANELMDSIWKFADDPCALALDICEAHEDKS